MTDAPQLYVIFAEAVARGHPDLPDGQICDLVLLQRGRSVGDAHRSIAGHLWTGGWAKWSFGDAGLVDDWPIPDDAQVVTALGLARRDGYAMVAYPRPLH